MKIHNTGSAKSEWANSAATILASMVIAATAMMAIGCGSSGSGGGTGGGASSTGGRGGTTGGTGGATVTHLLSYTFDTGAQMWGLSTYAEPAPRNNLGGIYPTDGGTDGAAADAGAGTGGPTLEWDSTASDPTGGGSLKLTATFTAYGQYVDPIINITAPGLALTGKTLHARLRLTSGMFTGGAQLHISTGANYGGYASAGFLPPVLGTWTTAALDLTTAVSSNPLEALMPGVVMQVGVQVFSGDAMPAGTPLVPPQAVVFNIDTITD